MIPWPGQNLEGTWTLWHHIRCCASPQGTEHNSTSVFHISLLFQCSSWFFLLKFSFFEAFFISNGSFLSLSISWWCFLSLLPSQCLFHPSAPAGLGRTFGLGKKFRIGLLRNSYFEKYRYLKIVAGSSKKNQQNDVWFHAIHVWACSVYCIFLDCEEKMDIS